MAEELFRRCCGHENNRGKANPAMQSEGGAATGVVATFNAQGPRHAILLGASLGDACAMLIRIDTGRAEQLT